MEAERSSQTEHTGGTATKISSKMFSKSLTIMPTGSCKFVLMMAGLMIARLNEDYVCTKCINNSSPNGFAILVVISLEKNGHK
jgi:hypothetical protein